VPVPAIIDQGLFDTAARLRKSWLPTMCAPRREITPNLLMGLLKCGHCGASMGVVTGKSGRYRYYKCSNRMRKGDIACPSKNFPLDRIDNLVLEAFKNKIYTPEHIKQIVGELRGSLSRNKRYDRKWCTERV
jgi:ssDNA-binding Zn-finger/Zn-ribbon topoisomerase 1